jgi:hypothetical protein
VIIHCVTDIIEENKKIMKITLWNICHNRISFYFSTQCGPFRNKTFPAVYPGNHPTSYTMGTGSSFPGVKLPGREVDHSTPTSAEVKKMWIYISTPPYAFMA